MKRLSVVIPAYNEERFIGKLIQRIQEVPTESKGFEKEIIVVDDGSTDRTFPIASQFNDIHCVQQANRGKGRAVQKGISAATGDFILVQDADLEYDPNDYLPMLEAIKGRTNISIYGSRILGQLVRQRGFRPLPGKHPEQGVGPWLAGVLLTLWTWILYGRWITDTLTAYKIYPRAFMQETSVITHGFETDHEITAKLARAGIEIEEVPIDYQPRSVEEGKKIKMSDGFIAVWTLLRFRL